ncbi:MAG: hypothetical protein Q8Q95_00295 [bacterium]|nr:hypothetical protein [bacterium]
MTSSTLLLQNGGANAIKDFKGSTTQYNWLNAYEPTAKIGYSIFMYKID